MTKNSTLHEEIHLKVMRLVQATPDIQQRDMAKALGVSLGKTNFCVNALVSKGLLKMNNFRTSKNKAGYLYLLTPQGIAEKAALTGRFLIRKKEEYELLKAEFDLLQSQATANNAATPSAPAKRAKATQRS
jgi:EPS-associated MarR family transcriptional regulator